MALKTIIRKELKELWCEGRVKWLFIMIALLLVVSITTSMRYSEKLKTAHDAAMLADRKVWDSQPGKNPHAAAHFGFYIFKPVHPLSMFEPGVDRYVGAVDFLEAHQRNSEQFSAIGDESDVARFGFLSPAFVLQLLMPLLVIVAGFNSISREKENGNLSLLFSQGCTPKKLFWGKWLSIYILLLFILVPAFLISLLTLVLLKAASSNYIAALLMFALYLLFYAAITNIVLFISSRVTQSGHAFLYCILFWMFAFILVPRITGNIAEQVSPLLTKEQIIDTVRVYNKERGSNIHAFGTAGYQHLVDSLLKKYGVDSVDQLPVNMAGIRLEMGEQMDTRNYELIAQQQFQRLNKQVNIITAGGVLSPFILSQQIGMALANTDVYSHAHFTDAGEQYRRTFVNIMNRHIAYKSGLQEKYTTFKAGKELWQKVPPFQYSQPGLLILAHYKFTIFLLLAWVVVTTWLARQSIRHFKPVK